MHGPTLAPATDKRTSGRGVRRPGGRQPEHRTSARRHRIAVQLLPLKGPGNLAAARADRAVECHGSVLTGAAGRSAADRDGERDLIAVEDPVPGTRRNPPRNTDRTPVEAEGRPPHPRRSRPAARGRARVPSCRIPARGGDAWRGVRVRTATARCMSPPQPCLCLRTASRDARFPPPHPSTPRFCVRPLNVFRAHRASVSLGM
jgi:hypothetical protein